MRPEAATAAAAEAAAEAGAATAAAAGNLAGHLAPGSTQRQPAGVSAWGSAAPALAHHHPHLAAGAAKAAPAAPGAAPTGSGRGHTKAAGLRAQAGALYRKNAAFQRRSTCSNLCLLSTPVTFCLILLAIQLAVNRLLLTGDEFECGCQCTRCCVDGHPGNCSSVPDGPCPFVCLERNRSACGIEFSSPRQSFFCAIPHPSSWPAVLQTPAEELRARPFAPRAVLPFTGDDEAAAASLSRRLLPPPDSTANSLTAAAAYRDAWAAPGGVGNASGSAVAGELLTLMGLRRLGTASRIQVGVYLEPALAGPSPSLFALFPDGTCTRLGLEGRRDVALPELLSALVNASNPPDAAAALNEVLAAQDTGGGGGGAAGGRRGQAAAGGLRVNCTDVALLPRRDAAELQRSLFCGYRQARCDGTTDAGEFAAAFDWRDSTAGVEAGGEGGPGAQGFGDRLRFSPDLYYNDTYGLPQREIPAFYQRVPQVINMAVNAWLRDVLGPDASAELIGVMETPKAASSVSVDFSSLLGPLFFTWVVQLLLPVFLMQLVYEKERGLRTMMRMHGLGDAAYWLVTYSWFLVLFVCYIVIFVAFGTALGLGMLRRNSYVIQLVFFFLFGNNMIALAFLLSCLFRSSRTAAVAAYVVVFGSGLVGSLLLSELVETNAWFLVLLELVPAFALFRGLFEMGQYAFLAAYRSGFGMALDNLADPGNGMAVTWAILSGECALFLAAAWLLEQRQLNNRRGGGGGRRWGCLGRLLVRRRRRGGAVAAGDALPSGAGASEEEGGGAPADVTAERRRVAALAGLAELAANPITVRGLRKEFPGQDGQPPKLAVSRLDLAVRRGECFGLLGPNGAGKSTSIGMLVGLTQPSRGSVLLGGRDVARELPAVYRLLGVCPQDDRLWEALTGAEHLRFYGRLKGIRGAELEAVVEASLRSINLWAGGKGHQQVRHYSGGMKRRLSVAISFVGDPLVVFLDEPSTGLDPASRRMLWDLVQANKPDRALVLTTHSMEEAEALCDRLGIFVAGRLVCIGTPAEIRRRCGHFLVFTLTVPPGQEAAAQRFVERRLSPGARLTYSLGGTLRFELPSSEVALSRVFITMSGLQEKQHERQQQQQQEKEAEQDHGAGASPSAPCMEHSGGATDCQVPEVLDWGVAHATLEEVFVKLAERAGAKAGD